MTKTGMVKKLTKAVKIVTGSIAIVLLLMFLLPVLFPQTVSRKIKEWTNQTINGELNFSKARLSFFNHFPSLTLTLYDFSLKGSTPFEKDTLVSTKELALGIDLKTVFSKKLSIDEIYVTGGNIHVEVDSTGLPNYNVYKSGNKAQPADNASDSSSASLQIQRIQIERTNLLYDDRSIPIMINARNLNYLGKGDLSKAIFDLASQLSADSFSLDYNKQHFIGSKKLKASLITKINTHSLALIFEKNDLQLNRLPFQFNGKFEFLKNGYNMDFSLSSVHTDLYDVLSALPPQYMPWFAQMDAKGKTEIKASLKGKYIAADNEMPTLLMSMKIRDGYLDYEKAPASLHNLYVDFNTALPQLNTDSLHINLDSLYFTIDKSYAAASLHLTGLNTIDVKANANASVDLMKLSQALGIQGLDMKGAYDLHLHADGHYATKVIHTGLRRVDTVLASIPSFSIHSSLKDGYFKYTSLPKAVTNIRFLLDAANTDGQYKHTTVSLQQLNAEVLDNYLKGSVLLKSNDSNIEVNAAIKTRFDLADISKFYPLQGIRLKGDLQSEIISKGIYDAAKKTFPVTHAELKLNNGSVQTSYYPHPIENIQINATVQSRNGSLKDLAVHVLPVSFELEQQPFVLKADLNNFANIRYNISSKGTIDVGKIYQVFTVKGYGLSGLIKGSLVLRGLQSDAMQERFDRLFNAGNLRVQNLLLNADLFPQPFIVKNGLFHFEQDKMVFDQFKATYGKSDFTLNGHLSNVINYVLNNAPLKGDFELNSKRIVVDEFMAYADSVSHTAAATPGNDHPATGVVIIPANLSLNVKANAQHVLYNGLQLSDVKGQLLIDSSKLQLKQSGFTLIGAPVVMDAAYQSISPKKAIFSYRIDAKDFDIRKAYNNIELFRTLASSAKSVQGIVSLEYTLAGRLDENMHPVYPSLKGGGVLSLGKVKVKGLKLMSAVSKATGRDSLDNPDLSKVNIKTTIANNIITIDRTKLRIFGFRPRFEGQVSFDGRLNLSGRIGLPPLGIFGIPFTVTGTQSKPVVKLRREKESDQLQQTEDKE
ncbi:MAG: AsmA family protein [Bacteroidota bacterium]|nr:AsmA family protein [Bacteroidota bacterium]